MITRQLELPEHVERKLQFASAAFSMMPDEFILAAISCALTCSAEEVPVLARAFELVPA
jgi:hypothetical protein